MAVVTASVGFYAGLSTHGVGAQSAPVASPSTCPTSRPLARFEPPDGQAYLGVSTHLITDGVDAWDAAAGIATHPALYGRWTTPDGAFQPILDEAATRPGITPIVHWNLDMTLGRVINGDQDAYIQAQADAVRAYGKPVFVRLDWEMNGFWYPRWNLANVTPDQFVASWRRVVSFFLDVPNAAFVWAPNALDYFDRAGVRHRTSEWYPGDDAVDWIGLDAYPQSGAPDLVTGIDGMNEMAQFAFVHGKPLMLAEWAPDLPHPDVADPVHLVFDWAERYPNTVKALVYFDFETNGRDYRLSSHPVGALAFRARTAGNPRYLTEVPGSVDPSVPPPATVPDSTTVPATVPDSTTVPASDPTTTTTTTTVG
jgi:hypothetical protein